MLPTSNYSLQLKDYHYNLPRELISQKPVRPRDHSRLLIINRKKEKIKHDFFYNIGHYLKKGDLLVLNNSRVIPARLFGFKKTGGKIEIFLLQKKSNYVWECLVRGKVKPKTIIYLPKKIQGILRRKKDSTWTIEFNKKNILDIGHVPLPPYIKKKSNLKEYQTVYAQKDGSVAAPTAGFHFTNKLLTALKKQGINIVYITLHVGLGTFSPVKTDNITLHKMHTEYFSINKKDLAIIQKAKKEKRRIIAVGTTSCRTLESLDNLKPKSHQLKSTNIFIYPGYRFKYVDALITNFHLPESTLYILVSAFASLPIIKRAYAQAIRKKYRFYSFGDATLII